MTTRSKRRAKIDPDSNVVSMADRDNIKKGNPAPLQLKTVKPLTKGQSKAFKEWNSGYGLFQHGVAGTGKTHVSLYLALKAIEDGLYNKLIIVRSAVPTRNQGFLPGSAEEKQVVYEEMYIHAINQLYQFKNAYHLLKRNYKIMFCSTSYLRGINMDDCIVVFDEIQNATEHEISTVMTRLGSNARVLLSGDHRQCDLTKREEISGIKNTLKRMSMMDEYIKLIEYDYNDIVRSDFCKAWIMSEKALDNDKFATKGSTETSAN